MRMLLVSLTLVALGLAAGGCDKPDPVAQPEAFDEVVDGGAPAPTVWVDRSLLEPRPKRESPPMEITPLVTSFRAPAAPQPAVEAEQTAAAAAAAAAATEEPVEVTQVKQAVTALAMGLKDKLADKFDFAVIVDAVDGAFVPEQAERIHQILARFEAICRAVEQLREVGTPILGQDPLVLLGEQGAAMAPVPVPAEQDMDPEQAIAQGVAMLPLERISATEVALLGDDGSPSGVVFRNVSGQWLIAVPAEPLAMVEQVVNDPAVAQALTGVQRTVEGLTQGLQSGTVTADNFADSAMALAQQEIFPSLMGLQNAVAQAMAQMQTAGPQQTASPQTPAAGTDTGTTTPDNTGNAYTDNAYGDNPW